MEETIISSKKRKGKLGNLSDQVEQLLREREQNNPWGTQQQFTRRKRTEDEAAPDDGAEEEEDEEEEEEEEKGVERGAVAYGRR